jgi:Domain of unknown function DUF29
MPEQTLLPVPVTTLYDQDFWLWTQAMASALKSGNFSQLDLENLAEEVESLGRSDRRELQSRLTVLLMHLLKWQFQVDLRSGSWKATLREQRRQIRGILNDSPSLRSFVMDSVDECYHNARDDAADETGLTILTFPEACPYAIDEILNIEFLPD